MTITKDMLVQDVIAAALVDFGMDSSAWNKYNLIEVSLERGVAERTANPQENMVGDEAGGLFAAYSIAAATFSSNCIAICARQVSRSQSALIVACCRTR